MNKPINKTYAWNRLAAHYRWHKKDEMKDLFARDKDRASKYTLNLGNLYLDYSKNRINDKTMRYLLNLTKEIKLKDKIDAMFSGEKINTTENRAVLHVALRNRQNTPIYVDGKNVMPEINAVLAKMKKFSDAVRFGEFRGATGKKLTNIVNIGIGGSDLGPFMATTALKEYWAKDMKCYFISNIDGSACEDVFAEVDPETTLFVVVSKTFTTIETLTNAKTCRKWLVDALGEHAVAKHFVAVSTNTEEVAKFGINTENMFEFWNFVGGRYSMWSAVGLSIALMVGMDNFEKMLDGANAMDLHFKNTEFEHNIPVILALLGVWYNNFFGFKEQGVIPYDQDLRLLPKYLQQLDMESNGKSVTMDNKFVKYATGPVLFGGAGTDVQHSFFQLLHQGTGIVPLDFIVPAISHNEIGEHHEILVANALAQGEALMRGKTVQEAATELAKAGKSKEEIKALKRYKSFSGNRPTNTIVIKKLDPYALGMLVAMYEHKVFVQGIIWNIDSFDQMGVELGKQMALSILPELQGSAYGIHDSSTTGLINLIKKIRR
uniref:Glucose-6-phosphate isomerase n=1 Tax=uncultured Alphaproteobacteria bacterium TaxID=91750 RepID=A0A6G8F3C7_9PROT|nr:glucose-6-phosphate isomerase [uncultured Alphaproteobacteria bacterium]